MTLQTGEVVHRRSLASATRRQAIEAQDWARQQRREATEKVERSRRLVVEAARLATCAVGHRRLAEGGSLLLKGEDPVDTACWDAVAPKSRAAAREPRPACRRGTGETS